MSQEEWEEGSKRHLQDLEFAQNFIEAIKGGYKLPKDERIDFIFDDMPEMKKLYLKNMNL
jgi:hypothetical protein